MQGVQTPHGSPSGFSRLPSGPTHERARARVPAEVVLPQPRGPVKRKAWATRPVLSALASVRTTCSWPVRSAKRCGRYLRASTRYAGLPVESVGAGDEAPAPAAAPSGPCLGVLAE